MLEDLKEELNWTLFKIEVCRNKLAHTYHKSAWVDAIDFSGFINLPLPSCFVLHEWYEKADNLAKKILTLDKEVNQWYNTSN